MTLTAHVFVNAITADNAVLALLDHAAITGWNVLDHRTYRLETGTGANAATIAAAAALVNQYAIVIALDSTGPTVYHIVARIRDERNVQ